MNVTIYGLIDPRDGRIRYVGKTTDLIRRFYRHCIEKENNFKYRWIQSLERKNLKPKTMILDFVPEEEWEQFERMWIKELKINHKLTNGTDGGDCGPIIPAPRDPKWSAAISRANKGRKLSEEHRAKAANWWNNISEERREEIRNLHRGKKASPETIEKLRKSHLGQKAWNKGVPIKEETRQKLRAANLGQKKPEWVKQKMRGRIVTEETKQKMRGKIITDEMRKKLSNAVKKSWERRKNVVSGRK